MIAQTGGAKPPMAPRVARRAVLVVAGYIVYVIAVQSMPISRANVPDTTSRSDQLRAIRAWRAAGCHTCHSMFGLGGHTGPDLTNIMSQRSRDYVRAMMIAGPPGMPSYQDLSNEQVNGILEYLSWANAQGSFPSTGWLSAAQEAPHAPE